VLDSAAALRVGVAAVAAVPAAALAGAAVVAAPVAGVPAFAVAGTDCVDGGVTADGWSTSLALVQAESAAAAARAMDIVCQRLIGPNTPRRRMSPDASPPSIHRTIKSRSWRDSGFGADSVVR
jgi:hypothetical protein